MSGVTKAISEELYLKAKSGLKEVSKSGDVSRKLQAIKSAKDHGITTVSKVFGVSRVTVMAWIFDFQKGGLEGLKLKPGRGRKHILNDKEREAVQSWLLKDHNLTIKAVKFKIAEAFGKELSLSATHNLIRKLNFSYITPRARHHKQDVGTHEVFKKKSRKNLSRKP